MNRLILSLVIVGAARIVASAQTASAPVLGWHVDPDAQTMSAILGIPGASRRAPARAVPSDIRLIRLSPTSSVVIALEGNNGWPILYDLATGVRTSLTGSRVQPAAAQWSPSGTALGLLYSEQRLLQLFARRNNQFELVTELATDATRFAISDDGTTILSALEAELLLQRRDEVRLINPGPVQAFTFVAGSTTPAFATSSELRIGDARIPLNAKDLDTVHLTSSRSDRLTVVQSGTGDVTTFTLAGDIVSRSNNCGCRVSGIAALGRPDYFRLQTDSADGPLWILVAAPASEVYFVPPVVEELVPSIRR